jgi:hypothetical protein
LIVAIALIAAETDQAPVSSTRTCSVDEPSGLKHDVEPTRGISLLPGLTTGMTKDEVKRFKPSSRDLSRLGSLELAPGVRGDVVVSYSEKTHLVNSVWMHLPNSDETYLALVRTFGAPGARKLEGDFVYFPPRMTEDVRPPDKERIKWCLPTRDIILWKNGDDFYINVKAAPGSPERG